MPILTTYIKHSFGSPSHSNQRTKINKRNPYWKGNTKLSVLVDDIVLYIEKILKMPPKNY